MKDGHRDFEREGMKWIASRRRTTCRVVCASHLDDDGRNGELKAFVFYFLTI